MKNETAETCKFLFFHFMYLSIFLSILRKYHEAKDVIMTDRKTYKNPNILKTAREQVKAQKKILKEVRDSIEKRNGKDAKK